VEHILMPNDPRAMPDRKLRVDEPGDPSYYGGAWQDAVASLARDLHVADGTRFIPSVEALAATERILDEPWVGVVHGRAPRLPFEDPLERLRKSDGFRANLRNCLGLWVMSQSLKSRLLGWNLAAPISQIHDIESDGRFDGLIGRIATNAIYRELPTPPSQGGEFRSFDLTVLLCSYKRVQNVGPILESLCNQTYSGSFEIIIWNNNIDAAADLEAAVAPFRSRLELTMLHSSRNFYCIVRLAVTHLIRGNALMICDDDVQPAPGYLATFVEGLRDAGDKAVVCARGNTFRPHTLNYDAPELVWERGDHLEFWEVSAPPREIHFMHGATCLIPRAALLELAALDLPRREFILVDDYWLSFALSGKLGWKIWKIQATDAFVFDQSAADPEVALHLNTRVREARTDFYVYHMSQGWPEGCSA
jgi:GT2 family glycosyltransferase